jgi:tungstate transport system substrate-binding protein
LFWIPGPCAYGTPGKTAHRRAPHTRRFALALLIVSTLLFVSPAAAQRFITVASTTSTEQSGLFKHLLPMFEKETGVDVRVVALGTGQALDLARRGDADVVFVHAKSAEEKFVAERHGVKRMPVMHNDFILIGPRSDPARVAGGRDILRALGSVKTARAPFVSRGDRSGTHIAELELWKAAGVDIAKEKGTWYRETGQGMGPALNTASSMNAYLLSDRATWLAFRNRGELSILVEADKRLFNQYGIILVNPEKHPNVKRADAQAFIDWIISEDGQKAIAAYRIGGEQIFFPNANDTGA